jgi:hypothetical protein
MAAGPPDAREGVRVATVKGLRAPALLFGVGLGGFIDGYRLRERAAATADKPRQRARPQALS